MWSFSAVNYDKCVQNMTQEDESNVASVNTKSASFSNE